jgi:hypothetical protein
MKVDAQTSSAAQAVSAQRSLLLWATRTVLNP